jgi:hypothetical protein
MWASGRARAVSVDEFTMVLFGIETLPQTNSSLSKAVLGRPSVLRHSCYQRLSDGVLERTVSHYSWRCPYYTQVLSM